MCMFTWLKPVCLLLAPGRRAMLQEAPDDRHITAARDVLLRPADI